MRARRAPHRPRALAVAARIDADQVALDLDVDLVGRRELQFALRAFDGDGMAVQLGGDAGGDHDGLFADTRHGSIPFVLAGQKTLQRTSPPT